ncbi:MAG: cell division protein SepF [Sciscionella sp.]
MSTLQKLKAYFGMIPADEVDGYDDEFDGRGGGYYADRQAEELDRFTDRRRSADYPDDFDDPRRARQGSRAGWSAQAPVRGALAMDPSPEPVTRLRPRVDPVASPAITSDHPLSRITALHLRSYNEARTIGEPYRDGIPVIMNLTEMEDADAKRLVDFAAGLAFALRGSIEKITTKVFLISPPNVDVTAEDKRRIVEGGFFGRG